MVEVYLEEWPYEDTIELNILMHIPGTDIYLEDTGYSYEHIEKSNLTDYFWKRVEEGDIKLTKLGEL